MTTTETPTQLCGIEGCPNPRRVWPSNVATFCESHDRAYRQLADRLRRDTGSSSSTVRAGDVCGAAD